MLKCSTKLDRVCHDLLEIYMDLKKQALNRCLAAYLKPNGSCVGSPPVLKGITDGAQQLVLALVGVKVCVQCRVHTFCCAEIIGKKKDEATHKMKRFDSIDAVNVQTLHFVTYSTLCCWWEKWFLCVSCRSSLLQNASD